MSVSCRVRIPYSCRCFLDWDINIPHHWWSVFTMCRFFIFIANRAIYWRLGPLFMMHPNFHLLYKTLKPWSSQYFNLISYAHYIKGVGSWLKKLSGDWGEKFRRMLLNHDFLTESESHSVESNQWAFGEINWTGLRGFGLWVLASRVLLIFRKHACIFANHFWFGPWGSCCDLRNCCVVAVDYNVSS